jgi:hypothetical protein
MNVRALLQMLIDCGFSGLTKQGEGKMPDMGFGIIKGHPNLRLLSKITFIVNFLTKLLL